MNELLFHINSLYSTVNAIVQNAQMFDLGTLKDSLFWLIDNLCWAAISRLCVELSRDVFHTLGHQWDWLTRYHFSHHAAYKPGYVKRWSAYFTSLQQHDLPEALIMVLIATTFAFLACTQPIMSGSLLGCLLVVLHTLKQLVGTILRIFKVEWALKTDTMHKTLPLTEPPSIWRVNRSYHLRHHFGDPMAYFGVNFSILDKLMKTALSLKGRTIGFANHLNDLEHTLRSELIQAGGRVIPHHEPIDFEKTCILIIDISEVKGICPEGLIHQMEAFLSTVHTDEEIVTKEIWLIVSNAENAIAWDSLDDLYQRFLSDWITRRRIDAPCILRKIVLGSYQDHRQSPNVVSKSIVSAVQRDIRNIVVRSPGWVYLLQPLKEWMVSVYFRLGQ